MSYSDTNLALRRLVNYIINEKEKDDTEIIGRINSFLDILYSDIYRMNRKIEILETELRISEMVNSSIL